MAVAHYLEALDWQRDVVKLHAIFGGKNPHPNFLVGGMPSADQLPVRAPAAPRPPPSTWSALDEVRNIINTMQDFVDQVYLPDTLAIAGFYKDWFARGEGVGNFLTVGDFPAKGIDDPSTWLIPSRRDPRTATCRTSSRSTCATRRRCRSSSPTPGTTTRAASRQGLHPLPGRDEAQLHRAEAALRTPRRAGQLLLAEVAALARQADGGRAAGAAC